MIAVASFYHFVALPDCHELQPLLKRRMLVGGLKGSILLAEEGINATIAGKREELDAFISALYDDPRFASMDVKYSHANSMPFERAKVRLKKEVIPFGFTLDAGAKRGVHVSPQDWNALIVDDDTLLIDTRNEYEVSLGTFKGARNPNISHFRDLAGYTEAALQDAKSKKIAVFCTGGIRCEKYSAYLLRQGFERVYQLEGGVLKYLETVPEPESQWDGACFVFDQRVGLRHGLTLDNVAALCAKCGMALACCEGHPAALAS